MCNKMHEEYLKRSSKFGNEKIMTHFHKTSISMDGLNPNRECCRKQYYNGVLVKFTNIFW